MVILSFRLHGCFEQNILTIIEPVIWRIFELKFNFLKIPIFGGRRGVKINYKLEYRQGAGSSDLS